MSLQRHLPDGKKWLYPCEGMHVYKGILCMADMTPEVMRWTEEVEFEDGDVLFVNYGESGKPTGSPVQPEILYLVRNFIWLYATEAC